MENLCLYIVEDATNFTLTKEENLMAERNFMIDWMRLWAKHFKIKEKDIIIPDNCEKYGFAEGKHNIGKMIQFFADMLEE
jgi:hypothetical protein